MITHQHIPPPEPLRPYVRYFWTMETVPGNPATFRTLADGSPGLIFCESARNGVYLDGSLLPGLFLYGQSTGHCTLSFPGNFRVVGVYLQPHALHSVFGMRADLITDGCVNMAEDDGSGGQTLYRKLSDTASVHAQIGLISAYLLGEIRKNKHTFYPLVQETLSAVKRTRGNLSLPDLQSSLRISERTLERKFKESIGLSPKLFLRIARFQASLFQLKEAAYNLTDLAYANSYADQSHFIRSFKEFAGMSPGGYLKQVRERVENLPELITPSK